MKKLSLRFRRALAAGLVLSSVATVAYAEMRIAVVDTQRAMMETEDGLRLQANLKKVFDKKQKELDRKQKELEQERADIEKQKGVLSQDSLQRRAESWQREMAELQQTYVNFNQELQKKQNEMTQPIFQKTMGLIRRLATSQGYEMVIDKQAVPYVRSDLDVTDRLITMYNNGGAMPQAPAPAAPTTP